VVNYFTPAMTPMSVVAEVQTLKIILSDRDPAKAVGVLISVTI